MIIYNHLYCSHILYWPLLSPGGIIEASPPSDSITAITANMVIEPDGIVKLIMVGDQVLHYFTVAVSSSQLPLNTN